MCIRIVISISVKHRGWTLILVCSCCCDKTFQKRWFLDIETCFLQFWKTRNVNSGRQQNQCLMMAAPLPQKWYLVSESSHGEETKENSGSLWLSTWHSLELPGNRVSLRGCRDWLDGQHVCGRHYVCFVCVYVHSCCACLALWCQKRVTPSQTELRMTVSHHVSPGDWIQVINKSSKGP